MGCRTVHLLYRWQLTFFHWDTHDVCVLSLIRQRILYLLYLFTRFDILLPLPCSMYFVGRPPTLLSCWVVFWILALENNTSVGTRIGSLLYTLFVKCNDIASVQTVCLALSMIVIFTDISRAHICIRLSSITEQITNVICVQITIRVCDRSEVLSRRHIKSTLPL